MNKEREVELGSDEGKREENIENGEKDYPRIR